MSNSEINIKKEYSLYERAVKVIPGGVSRNVIYRRPHPFYVEKGSGCYITDINGVEKVDFAYNVASLIHGHAHPAITEAVCGQLSKGTAFVLATETEIEFAEYMCNRVSGFEKIRFLNSGTEAVMAMLKAARAYTGKPVIAKAEGAYHGSYDIAEVSQSASPATWGNIDEPEKVPHVYGTPSSVLDNVIVFPFNDTKRTLNLLEKYSDRIACVLIDPVPHRVCMTPAEEEFIENIYSWTYANNSLLCFDEVISFRVNYEGAQEFYKVKPDLTSLGKIIGGGFPIGALAGKKEIIDVLDPGSENYRFPLSGTFSANPVSMIAGKTAMELFDKEEVRNINSMTEIARNQIKEAGKLANIPLSITGAGSMLQIHFTEIPPKTYRDLIFTPEHKTLINRFLEHLYEKNIIIINSCTCVLSTVVTQKEIDMLAESMLSAFRHIKPLLNK